MAADHIKALFSNQRYTRMGLRDCYWQETLVKWAEEGHIQKISDDPNLFYEYRYNVDEVIPFDMEIVGGFIDENPLLGFSEVLEETEDWITVKNGAGASLKTFKHSTGVPEHVGFEMTTPALWQEKYRAPLLELNPARLHVEMDKNRLQRAQKLGRFTMYGQHLLVEQQRAAMGDVCMLESILLEPEWIWDYNEVYTNFLLRHFEYLFEHAGKPDGMWLYEDLAYKHTLFFSPEKMRELYLPFYKRIVNFLHERGITAICHSCGMVEKALPILVEAGFDGLNPIEIKAGCDLLKFAAEYKDHFVFIGGIDVQMLERGDKEKIRREIERVCKGMKELGARYVFSSDHSVPPTVEFETFRYATKVFRQNMNY